MKRHPALVPLSKEHHDALILAQLLKKDNPGYKGLPTDPSGKAVYALNKFKTSLCKHFAKEEAMLEKVKDCNLEVQKLANEIIQEHKLLSGSFLLLEKSGNLITEMDILGHALEKHIRKEERILFPLMQKYVPEELIGDIAHLIA
jgi:iron-sulfur cluster repair protein YtfE (RIC family)